LWERRQQHGNSSVSEREKREGESYKNRSSSGPEGERQDTETLKGLNFSHVNPQYERQPSMTTV